MTLKIIGALNKSDTAEVRITTSLFKGRDVVDVRVWYKPDGSNDLVPSRKGITMDSAKIKELVEVLNRLL
jgi:hypothetical protein